MDRGIKMNVINISYDSTNYYLIQTNSCWIMVDTGWPGTLRKYLNLLKQRQININEIKYLIITHYHPDHAGLVQDFKDLGIQLILHTIQIPYVEELKAFFKRKTQYPFKDILLTDNIVLSSKESRMFFNKLGIEAEIIPTSGHSEDSISLVIDNCCAFTGDLPWLSFVDVTLNPKVNESWSYLKQYHIKTIYPGHGNAFNLKNN